MPRTSRRQALRSGGCCSKGKVGKLANGHPAITPRGEKLRDPPLNPSSASAHALSVITENAGRLPRRRKKAARRSRLRRRRAAGQSDALVRHVLARQQVKGFAVDLQIRKVSEFEGLVEREALADLGRQRLGITEDGARLRNEVLSGFFAHAVFPVSGRQTPQPRRLREQHGVRHGSLALGDVAARRVRRAAPGAASALAPVFPKPDRRQSSPAGRCGPPGAGASADQLAARSIDARLAARARSASR
jgi:hypothetical protein